MVFDIIIVAPQGFLLLIKLIYVKASSAWIAKANILSNRQSIIFNLGGSSCISMGKSIIDSRLKNPSEGLSNEVEIGEEKSDWSKHGTSELDSLVEVVLRHKSIPSKDIFLIRKEREI